MILIDSSYLTSLVYEKDKDHNRAVELLDEIENETKFLPLLMLSETITNVNARLGGKVAKELYETLSREFIIYYPSIDDIEKSMNCVLKYSKNLSLADCLASYLMKKNNILYIYSFDSDFDKIEGIIRKY